MLQLNTWTHPKTGQTRVYVNGAPFQSGVKLFVERIDANEFGDDWHVVVVADWGMDRRQARDSAADAIEELVGHRCTFDQIVAAANR